MVEGFDSVFARLRGVMLEAAPAMTVAKDAAGSLELRTPALDPKTGQPGWFGTVTIKKTYVAYHLMPLYERPQLAEDLSPALSKRRQGKTCFNFARTDELLFDEIARLTRACVAYRKSVNG